MPRFLRGRPTLAAALIYAVLSLLMVGQGLLPGRTLSGSDALLGSIPWGSSTQAGVRGAATNFELADSAEVFQPFLQYTRAQLPQVPLWNPNIMAGRPLLADAQSAVFSPFSVPSYVLPFWKSLAVVAMLKLFIGALGAYVLGRLLGMRFGGALLAGTVFAFGTFFVVWLAWPLTSVYAFIPWALALTELLVRRPGVLPATGLAAVTGLQFLGGHPESSFHLIFATVLFFGFRLLRTIRRRKLGPRALVHPTLLFGAAMLAGAGMAALVLAPFLEFVLNSGDLARRAHAAAGFWPRKYIGALFLHDYWGRPTQLDLEQFMQVRGWYAGAATLMLAAAALLLRRSAERVAFVVFALFCTCMVIGIAPVFGFVSSLPGFSAAHNERLLIYVLLCLALLAGWGLDDLSSLRPQSPAARRGVLMTSGVILCVPILWMGLGGTLNLHRLGSGLNVAWGFAHPPLPPLGVDVAGTASAAIVRDSALLIWLPLAGAALVLIALRVRRSRALPPAVFVALTVTLLAIDLFRANMGFNPAIAQARATPPTTGAIRYLQSRRPNRFIGVSTVQFSQPLPDDLAMTFGLFDARGYDFPVEKRLDRLWRASIAPGAGDFTQPEEFAGVTDAALRALNLLSVSDVLLGPANARAAPLHRPGLRVAYSGPDAVVYANARALPRVFVADRQQSVSSDDAAFTAITAPGFDGRNVAITEHRLPGIPDLRGAPPSRPAAGARAAFASYGAERIVIDASTDRRAVLVLTDNFYPGWTATVDGHATAVQRVDYLLRGVSLPPGRHTVVFRYQPASWRVGWIITLLSVLALLTAAGFGLRRARRQRVERAAA